MERRPGVGIIGLGAIGRIHAEAVRMAGGRLRAVAVRAGAASPTGDETGVRVVDDYRRLLDDAAVEVVHICTPNALHYPIARDALQAGKHVVCEKPLTLTSAEAAALWQQATTAGLVHAINFNNRFYPLVREARARQIDGDLGRVFAVRGTILEDSLLGEQALGWRLDPRQGGDSCAMATIGCHLIDLLSFVLDSPIIAVCADFTTVHPVRGRPGDPAAGDAAALVAIDAEEVAHLLVRFASGASGVLGLSQASAGRRYRIAVEVDGTAAALRWESETPNQLWMGFAARPNQITLADPALLHPAARPYARSHGAYPDGFTATIATLLGAVYGRVTARPTGALDYPTFADGYRALLVHEAVLASARGRTWAEVTPGEAAPAGAPPPLPSHTTGDAAP